MWQRPKNSSNQKGDVKTGAYWRFVNIMRNRRKLSRSGDGARDLSTPGVAHVLHYRSVSQESKLCALLSGRLVSKPCGAGVNYSCHLTTWRTTPIFREQLGIKGFYDLVNQNYDSQPLTIAVSQLSPPYTV